MVRYDCIVPKKGMIGTVVDSFCAHLTKGAAYDILLSLKMNIKIVHPTTQEGGI